MKNIPLSHSGLKGDTDFIVLASETLILNYLTDHIRFTEIHKRIIAPH